MDQTLHSDPHTYGIVGNGRVATHFAHYFSLLGIAFRQWSRASAAMMCVDPTSMLRETMQDCTHILLLIKDTEIEPFIRTNPFLQSKRLVHCSGSLVTELAIGYHPLFSFSHTLYERATYESIPMICDAGGPSFKDAFPLLPNPWITIEPSLKPYYHALCVLSGNFTTLVWQKTFKEFEARLGIPPEFALLYLRSIVHNLIHSPADALTGPIARKDMRTIGSNLAALEGDAYVHLYKAILEIVEPGRMKETES
ncbi:MAG: DUF2520 domain-containing protein [Ignavibacteriales bacterium]|nr:DUF2520 domain-containing protein [Ignavibacteriales bacterium]